MTRYVCELAELEPSRQGPWTRLARRCRIALSLLMEPILDATDRGGDSRAPHGFDRVPMDGELESLQGEGARAAKWQLVPTVEEGCSCRDCRGRRQ